MIDQKVKKLSISKMYTKYVNKNEPYRLKRCDRGSAVRHERDKMTEVKKKKKRSQGKNVTNRCVTFSIV